VTQWIRQWRVPASSNGTWTVSLKRDGSYACSCPAWKFAKAPKPDWGHIDLIKVNPGYNEVASRRIVLADVCEVSAGSNDELLTPLIPAGDLHFALTVACDLARMGAGFEEVRRYLHGNSLTIAREYISAHGRKIYAPRSETSHRHNGFQIVQQVTTQTDI
jgi:hypothetical protein